jgi:phenylpyruvate tautomerase PptA (4-oxalocrotonate tautomerase family)
LDPVETAWIRKGLLQLKEQTKMPWINLTIRRGAFAKPTQHAIMAKLTEVLMWWEKVPETPNARSIMKGWVYEVAEDADYSAGRPDHQKPFYFLEIRIPINRLDLLAKQGLIRDFTRVVLDAEGSDNLPENARRVWVTINELKVEDWGVGGHTDWLRDYTSALDQVGDCKKPAQSPREPAVTEPIEPDNLDI